MFRATVEPCFNEILVRNFPLKIKLTQSALQTTCNEIKQRQSDLTKIDKFDLQYGYRYKNNKRQIKSLQNQ